MTARPEALAPEVLVHRVADLAGWSLVEGKLHRELVMTDFTAAFALMTRIALVAERLNHHPEWSNVYNRVTIDLVTHDVGGVTELDLRVAAAVNEALGEGPS